MSVFGGDSWAREAQNRKRRVEDLAIEGVEGSSYRKLSNGKFACLVCPNFPVLDSSIMLSVHCKGSKHRAAESRLKERELTKRDEINKRIALSRDSSISTSSGISSKRLLKQTHLTTYEVLRGRITDHETRQERAKAEFSVPCIPSMESGLQASMSHPAKDSSNEAVTVQHYLLDPRERREMELKFTSAGWKRDGNGRWFKDENVEFDSDEEDPNVCLA
ncbi:hypothetical protein SAY86_004220 [Trapa natans]|uniref:Sodium channel modifier 1 n=1 Tax=Trapa natans TaxID=22666 RepID=A0AAN7M7D5_TRANT|nr:hypothetical protein SAY86_004220 [Trapa natans]